MSRAEIVAVMNRFGRAPVVEDADVRRCTVCGVAQAGKALDCSFIKAGGISQQRSVGL